MHRVRHDQAPTVPLPLDAGRDPAALRYFSLGQGLPLSLWRRTVASVIFSLPLPWPRCLSTEWTGTGAFTRSIEANRKYGTCIPSDADTATLLSRKTRHAVPEADRPADSVLKIVVPSTEHQAYELEFVQPRETMASREAINSPN